MNHHQQQQQPSRHHHGRQRQQYGQPPPYNFYGGQPDPEVTPEVTPEQEPLLPTYVSSLQPQPPQAPLPPPPPSYNRTSHSRTRSVDFQPVPAATASNNHHLRTKSVDFQQIHQPHQSPSQPRKMAPGRRHHERTRSLEEWANMFGIAGISGGDDDIVHDRKDVLRKKARSRPPLPPKATSASPTIPFSSPSAGGNRKQHKRLDSIVETDLDLEEEEEKDDEEEPETIYDGGRAAFMAAALAGQDSYHTNSEGSTQSYTVTLPNKPYHSPRVTRPPVPPLSSPSPRGATRAVARAPPPLPDDLQSVDSHGSSTIFSLSQQLSHSHSGGGDRYDGGTADDSSVDDNSTTLDLSKSQSSPGSSTTYDYATTERLAKFEKEQELMFQQKKYSMERELSNVLERNAVQSHRERQEFINTYMMELERERAKLVAQWKEEWQKEEEYLRQRDPNRRLLKQLSNKIGACLDACMYFFSNAEVFISNMPLTIAAFALSWVSMGCVWFKFMEENIEDCSHVHFYSPHCTFPEFPGCFECDVSNKWYIVAVNWHYLCSLVSFTFCAMIILKVIIAWDVVVDELSNPTTSTPCGVFCIAMVCVFAGRGPIGELIVLLTATFHFMLAFFFLYMALVKYRLWPDPGWFPNTVGISYAAVKSFLYFPMYGEILMILCLTFFFGVFFISALRVATNPKIAAPICWFMISAPSITLYAVTLIPQPVASEEYAMQHNPQLKAHFDTFLQHYFLPLHHFLFACSLIGVVSAVHGVWSRWDKLKEKPFSPAHAAFVAPTLSHTNAIQAYRGTVAALSSFPAGGKYRTAIYIYWCFCLFSGTIVNFIFTYKFLRRLPAWTKVDVSDEEAPPDPSETMTHEMLDDRGAHETMLGQSFVNPAVLEANEAGALVRVRRGTEDYRRYGPFIRTRKVTARGFDPSMNDAELRQERAALLDWVAKNAPRKRNRTMSIPGVMHLRDKAGRGVYGTFVGGESFDSDTTGRDSNSSRRSGRHARSRTSVDGFW